MEITKYTIFQHTCAKHHEGWTSPASIMNSIRWLSHREVTHLSTFSPDSLKDLKARALYASNHILRLFALC